MSEQFAGVCVGGPYDGRQSVYFARMMPVNLGPEFSFMDIGKEDFEVEMKRGYYFFDDGKWQWQT